jgi:hypothetical protein
MSSVEINLTVRISQLKLLMMMITLNSVRDACFNIDFVIRPIDLNMGLRAFDALWRGISEIA